MTHTCLVKLQREGHAVGRLNLNDCLAELLANWNSFLMPIQHTDGILPEGEYTAYDLRVMSDNPNMTLLQAIQILEELQSTNYQIVLRNIAMEFLIEYMDTHRIDLIHVFYE
jgi:hypothetical protein